MSPGLKNTLIGCGIALGLFFMVGAVSCISFIVWLNRPGTLIEPQTLIGEETTGYVAWTLRREDEGTRRTVERLLESLHSEQKSHQPFPGWMGEWLAEYQEGRNRRQIEQLFPIVLAYTIRPGEVPEDDLGLFTVSIQGLGNRMVLIDWMLGFAFGMSGEVESVTHRGEKILTMGDPHGSGATFFIRGNDLFLTSDEETARRTVDALLATGATSGLPGSGIGRLLDRVPSDSALRGAVTNRRGEIGRLVATLAGDDGEGATAGRLPELAGIAISGGFEDETTFKGRIDCLASDPIRAGEHAEEIAGVVRHLLAGLHLDATTRFSVEGSWVLIDYEIEDPAAQLGSLIDFDRLKKRDREGEGEGAPQAEPE